MLRRSWPGLDGLRGIAVLAVVAFHLGLLSSGFLGVDVFFVLSGFLITGVVVNDHSEHRLRRFYLRRFFRLYPALVVVVLFVIAVSVVTHRARGRTLHDGVAALAYVANVVPLHGLLDHAWTLALEEQFYLVWPALLLIGQRSTRRWRYAPGVFVVAVLLLLDAAHGQAGFLHSYVRAMGLPLGCALALAPASFRMMAARLGPVCLAVLLLALVPSLPAGVTTGWPVSVAALLTVPIVAWVVETAPLVLSWTWLRWFGTRSYSLYLWHFPVVSLVFNHAPAVLTRPERVVVAGLATLVAGEASYGLVERPFLRLRDRLLRSPAVPRRMTTALVPAGPAYSRHPDAEPR